MKALLTVLCSYQPYIAALPELWRRDEISREEVPSQVGSITKKRKLTVFSLYFRRAPPEHWIGPHELGMGTVSPKIGPCRPVMDPQMYVNCLFSPIVDSESL